MPGSPPSLSFVTPSWYIGTSSSTESKACGPSICKRENEDGMLGENELKNIADRILEMSPADQTEVLLFSTTSALTRFANNYIHQNVEQTDIDLRVRSVIGRKIGIASTNNLSVDGLTGVAAR